MRLFKFLVISACFVTQIDSFPIQSKVASNRSTLTAPSPALETEKSFEKWAAGAGIKAPKLTHETFLDGYFNLRGIYAKENIERNEVLVSLPGKVCLRIRPGESSPFRAWTSDEAWMKQPWYSQLALKLLWEKSLGKSSSVSGYVDLLPPLDSFQTPIHWSNEELELLEYPSLQKSVLRQRKAWEDLHSDLRRMCSEGVGRIVSYDEYVWAIECALSRAFSGNYGTSLLTFGAVASAVSIGVGVSITTAEPWGLLGAVLALLPLSYTELMNLFQPSSARQRSDQDRVLLPFVDSINHSSRVSTELAYSPISNQFTVKVDRNFDSGAQVFISYGKRGNTELLQFYGFVEEDNPHDDFLIKLSGDQTVCIMRGGMAEIGENVNRTELITICREKLLKLRESLEYNESTKLNVHETLAFQFRREKARILQEFIANF